MKKDWKKIVSEYYGSGLSQREFARSRGLNVGSLAYHLKRTGGESAFVRVRGEERIELELPGGIVLRVTERDLPSVLKALQA